MWKWLKGNWGAKIIALVLGLALWYYVNIDSTRKMELRRPINISLPPDLILSKLEPGRARVTLEGKFRDLLNLDPRRISINISPDQIAEGEGTIGISPLQVESPQEIRVIKVLPAQIEIELQKK